MSHWRNNIAQLCWSVIYCSPKESFLFKCVCLIESTMVRAVIIFNAGRIVIIAPFVAFNKMTPTIRMSVL